MVTGITAVQGGRSYASALSSSNGATPLSGNTASQTPSAFNRSTQNGSSNTLSVSSLWNSAPLYGKAAIVAAAVVTSPVWAPLAGISMLLGSGCTPETTSSTDGGTNGDSGVVSRAKITSYPTSSTPGIDPKNCAYLDSNDYDFVNNQPITMITVSDGKGGTISTPRPTAATILSELSNVQFGGQAILDMKVVAPYVPIAAWQENIGQYDPHTFYSVMNFKLADGTWQGGVIGWALDTPGTETIPRYYPDLRFDPSPLALISRSNLYAGTPVEFVSGLNKWTDPKTNTLYNAANNVALIRKKGGASLGPIVAVGVGPQNAAPLKKQYSSLMFEGNGWFLFDGLASVSGYLSYYYGVSSDNNCASFYSSLPADNPYRLAYEEQLRTNRNAIK